MSQPTMHAAITALTFAGLLRTVHGVGTYVARPKEETILPIALRRATSGELHSLRLDLELVAARRAAGRRTDRDLERLWFVISELRIAVMGGSAEEIAAVDVEVHREVVRAAHNPLLTYLHQTIGRRIEEDLAGRIGLAIREQEIVGLHQAIADALESRRAELVATAVARTLREEGPMADRSGVA